jgi:hypothetical protein
MNVGQLKELLDNYGDHLEVIVEDKNNDQFNIDTVGNVQTSDGPVVVIYEEQ